MTSTDLVAELRAAIEAQSYPEIMTPAQAAEFLGVSEVVRYERTDLINWLRRSRIAA